MNCQEIRQLLSAYMDGQLENSEHEYVSTHLETCASCQVELEELQEVVGLLHLLPELSPPADFRTQLRQRIGSELEDKPEKARFLPAFSGGRWARFIAAAAVICLAVGITALWQSLPAAWNKKEIAQDMTQINGVDGHSFTQEFGSVAGMAENGKEKGTLEPGGLKTSNVPAPEKNDSMERGNNGDQSTNTEGDALPEKNRSARPPAGPPPEKTIPLGLGGEPGTDQEMGIMAVPPPEEEIAGGQENPLPTEKKQDYNMTSLLQEDESTSDKSKVIKVTTLVLQIENVTDTKKRISSVVERYKGIFIEDKQNNITVSFLPEDYKDAVTDISKIGSLLDRRSEDRDISGGYNGICAELTRLYAEEQHLSHKENLTPDENELLQEVRVKIKECEKQLQQFDSMVNKNVIEITLKTP